VVINSILHEIMKHFGTEWWLAETLEQEALIDKDVEAYLNGKNLPIKMITDLTDYYKRYGMLYRGEKIW